MKRVILEKEENKIKAENFELLNLGIKVVVSYLITISYNLYHINLFRIKFIIYLQQTVGSQSAFTCSKLTIETLEKGVKYVQSLE